MDNKLKIPLIFAALTIFCMTAAIAGWPVDSLNFSDSGGAPLLRFPMGVGHSFTTSYIHSVELTPVEDEYFALNGRIWQWQERVKSSNAGMPCFEPENGRFIRTDEWLVFQGGRKPWKRFYLRVGNERFGRNGLEIAPFLKAALYKAFPGMRITVWASKAPLIMSPSFEAKPLFKE